MKVTKPFYLLSLVALALTGCNSSKGGGGGGSKFKPLVLTEEQQAIYEQYYCNQTDCFGNEGRTYDIINKVGADLMLELHKYLIDQHHHYLIYSSKTTNEVNAALFEKVDKNDEGQIELFYTGKTISSYGSGQNREHVWPCANSGGLWYRDADCYATFIFGIGVDYSIFVMNGLTDKNSQKLAYHKTAIFFSAVTLIVTVSSMVLAVHPAIKSVGFSTLVGLLSAVILSYVIQPAVYRWLNRKKEV